MSYLSLLVALREYGNQSSDEAADALIQELEEFQDVNSFILSGDLEQKQLVSYIFKVLSKVDSRSRLAWTILDVLADLCNANENERVLNHLQKLTPLVSNFMLGTLEENRQVAVLKVLQALTYGIRIQHPDIFIAPLISSLIDLLKPGTKSSIIQLSLSVMCNLLHRNKAVLLSLVKTVKVKDFMNDLLIVQNNISCKLEVCKLMFLLEDFAHEKPDDVEITSFLRVSFRTVMESASSKRTSHLRHCVSFFVDLVNEKKINVSSLNHPWFFESVEKVIDQLCGLSKSDLDSAMLLFRFLRVFIKMEIPSFSNFHNAMMKQGIAWTIEHKRKASEAIITMQCILASQIQSQSCQGDGMTVDELISVFVPLLSETCNSRSDTYFLTGLLDFLSTVLEVELYNIVLKEYFDKEIIEGLLEKVPSIIDIQRNFDLYEPALQMYVQLFLFVNKIVTCCNNSWKNFYTCLFREQRLVTILAAALVYGSSELKGKVLSLVANDEFPRDSLDLLSKSMAECGSGRPLSLPNSWDKSNEQHLSSKIASTYVDVNKFIRNINNSNNCEKLQEISSSKVFGLYAYKEQVNSDFQESLVSSLTHASREKALLQEELLIANHIISEHQLEVTCLHKTLEDVRKENNSFLKAFEETKQDMANLKHRLIEEKTNSQSQIQKLKESSETYEKELIQTTLQIQHLKQELVEKADCLKTIREEHLTLKEEQENLNNKVESLTKDLECTGLELERKRGEVLQLELEKKAKEKEITELQRIRDTVFELTGGRKKFS